MSDLKTITQLSHEFGTELYVRGGGGNTSVKDASTLWVKPSGTTLSGLTEESFVKMNRSKIDALYEAETPQDPDAREALVKDFMAQAVLPDSSGRPSVEAPLHNAFPAKFVVHVHPALVNGMTCAQKGRETCQSLFPDSLWAPYVDPGYTLCVEVRKQLIDHRKRTGQEAKMLFLENHGVFVAGDTAEEIRALYQEIMDKLREAYGEAGVKMQIDIGSKPDNPTVEKTAALLREALADDATDVRAQGLYAAVEGPLSPDHIVYSKSYPYTGALTVEGLRAFREEMGYAPRIIKTENAVYAAGSSPKVAELALELSEDGALVAQLTAAFGGVQFMTDRARGFIENWEVEAYRAKQMQ